MSDPLFMKEDDDILIRLDKKMVYLQTKAEAQEKALEIWMDTFKVYANNIDKRLDNANHFKDLHVAQSGTFITRIEFEKITGFQNKIVGIGLTISVGIPLILTILNLIKR